MSIRNVIIFSYVVITTKFVVDGLIGEHVKNADEKYTKKTLSFMASIMFINPSGTAVHRCGGAVISNNHILTANSCLYQTFGAGENAIEVPLELSKIVVRVGTIDNEPREGKLYNVEKVIDYKEFVEKVEKQKIPTVLDGFADIAVLRLDHNVDKEIQIGVLSSKGRLELSGQIAVVAGWGITKLGSEGDTTAITRKLQIADQNILRQATCISKLKKIFPEYEQFIYVPNAYLCSQSEPATLLANGDAGSPLLLQENGKLEIIGVASSSKYKTDSWEMGVNEYMHVNYFRDFIDYATDGFTLPW